MYLCSVYPKISSFFVTPQYLCCKWQLCVSFEWNIDCRVTIGCVTISTPTCVWKSAHGRSKLRNSKTLWVPRMGIIAAVALSVCCLVAFLQGVPKNGPVQFDTIITEQSTNNVIHCPLQKVGDWPIIGSKRIRSGLHIFKAHYLYKRLRKNAEHTNRV